MNEIDLSEIPILKERDAAIQATIKAAKDKRPISDERQEFLKIKYGELKSLPIDEAIDEPPTPHTSLKEAANRMFRLADDGFVDLHDIPRDDPLRLYSASMRTTYFHTWKKKNDDEEDDMQYNVFCNEPEYKRLMGMDIIEKSRQLIAKLPFHYDNDRIIWTEKYLTRVSQFARIHIVAGEFNYKKKKKSQLLESTKQFYLECIQCRKEIVATVFKSRLVDFDAVPVRLEKELGVPVPRKKPEKPKEVEPKPIHSEHKTKNLDTDIINKLFSEDSPQIELLPSVYRPTKFCIDDASRNKELKKMENYVTTARSIADECLDKMLVNRASTSQGQRPSAIKLTKFGSPNNSKGKIKGNSPKNGRRSSIITPSDENSPKDNNQRSKVPSLNIRQNTAKLSNSSPIQQQLPQRPYTAMVSSNTSSRPESSSPHSYSQCSSVSRKPTAIYSSHAQRPPVPILPHPRKTHRKKEDTPKRIDPVSAHTKFWKLDDPLTSRSGNFIEPVQQFHNITDIDNLNLLDKDFDMNDPIISGASVCVTMKTVPPKLTMSEEMPEFNQTHFVSHKELPVEVKPEDLVVQGSYEVSHNKDALMYLLTLPTDKTESPVHDRLEQIWDQIGFSITDKLNMVLKYSHDLEESSKLSEALDLWEEALRTIDNYNKAYSAYKDFLKLDRSAVTGSTMGDAIRNLQADLDIATKAVRRIAELIKTTCGDELIIKRHKADELIEIRKQNIRMLLQNFNQGV